MYRLILLGGANLEGPSGPLRGPAGQRRVLGVLAILSRSSAPVTRERLVGLLWPDHPEDRARARLSDVLYVVRRELGADVVVATGDALELDPERIQSDVAAFEEAADAERWAEAVELYGGEFLEGFHPSRSPAFERWLDEERRRLAERYREGLEALAEEAEGAEDWGRAVAWWRRRASEEPTNSRVATRLMSALAATGDVGGALKHARVHELLLEEELGVPLPAEVRDLSEQLAGEAATQRPVEGAGAARASSGTGQHRAEARAPPGAFRLALPGAVVLAGLTAGGLWLSDAVGTGGDTWVEAEAIPEIEALSQEGRYHDAWSIARRAQEEASDHPALDHLLPQFTWRWPELRSEPPGARVLYRPYGERDASWQELGTTPLEPFRLPLEPTVLRLEREGYEPVHLVPDHYLDDFPVITLDPPEDLPEGMVRIPGWTESLGGETLELGDFLLGRHPVTNREYQRFVEAGGYREPEHWNHPFVVDGDTLSWDEAMERFTDRTGRPGPSTWVGGTYPEGEGDHPVSGVSWYEAAAYAEFAGKALPSVHHWRRAYGSPFFPEHAVPESNLDSDGPAPVEEHAGMGPFGTLDMVGNVREWTHNEVGEDRHILGGGWNDPDYMALLTGYTQPAFDRFPTNGFRLAHALDDDSEWEAARAPVEPEEPPDFVEKASHPDDQEFEIFQRMFAYDPTPLEPELLATDTARHWVRETVAFEAPYEGSRVLVHLYLPRGAEPPFQTVVYWPGGGARTFRSIDVKTELHTDFIVQSGRAVAFPVLKGTLERLDEVEEARPPHGTALQRDRVVQQVQDLRRTIDYLELREDIDAERLGYFGWSWGGWIAPVLLALEPRFEGAVLHVAGITGGSRPLPEVDPLNYFSRVTLPVLMLNGRLDAVYPLETHARPFYELLGTPSEDKRLVVADGGHFVPRPKLVEESLAWLDAYLGPVEAMPSYDRP